MLLAWTCLGKDADRFSSAEEAAVDRLAAAHERLMMCPLSDGRVNTQSEDGSSACSAFLEELSKAARAMRLDQAPRSYRDSFTINYRALFPDGAHNYHIDVLEASFAQYAVIWVNGDKFEFSAGAMRCAEALQRAWSEVGALLKRWREGSEQPRVMMRPARSELRTACVTLDFAWASFERKYITELIEIEVQARRFIVQAIEQERRVTGFESLGTRGEAGQVGEADPLQLLQLPEYRDAQTRLVSCIANLNSVANIRRKGRDDLRVSILFNAMETLGRCDAAGGEGGESLRAARILATDVVDSFQCIRAYLREVAHFLERVDPQLCNNSGLVARLVDWEESWEIGARYMQQERLLGAICSLVAELRVAQRLVPALATMCEECDVEFFMVLPRIILLCFLAQPVRHADLLRSLLPHRFVEPEGDSGKRCVLAGWDTELAALAEEFSGLRRLIVSAMPTARGLGSKASRGAADGRAWELLLTRAAAGASAGVVAYGGLAPELRGKARDATEALLQRLEPWSIELQRHCPEDWNQCSATLVQCLTKGIEKRKSAPFRV